MEFNIKYSFKVLSNYNGIMTVAIYVSFGDDERLVSIISGKEDEMREKLKGYLDDSTH